MKLRCSICKRVAFGTMQEFIESKWQHSDGRINGRKYDITICRVCAVQTDFGMLLLDLLKGKVKSDQPCAKEEK